MAKPPKSKKLKKPKVVVPPASVTAQVRASMAAGFASAAANAAANVFSSISPVPSRRSREDSEPKPLVPMFWVRNIERLRSVISRGPIYFDVIESDKSYSVRMSNVKYGHPEYSESSIELFLIHKRDIHGDERKINDFIEPSACAAILTVQGFEVFYPTKNHLLDSAHTSEADDDFYLSFSESAFNLASKEKQDKLNDLLGGSYFSGSSNVVSNSKALIFSDSDKYLSKKDLYAVPGPEDKIHKPEQDGVEL